MGSFQSTPPVKAATANTDEIKAEQRISIHAAREGGDTVRTGKLCRCRISIHAAREGGDPHRIKNFVIFKNFNPRRP